MDQEDVSFELLHDRLNAAIEQIKRDLPGYVGSERFVMYGNAMGFVGALLFAGLIDQSGYDQLYDELLMVLHGQ